MDGRVPTVFGENGKLLHAYIVSGGTAETREDLARVFAKGAVCDGTGRRPCGVCAHCRKADKGLHPDIQIVEKHGDKTELTVDIMRAVRADAFVLPNEAARKVYIIRDADTMNLGAQNAMLKVFEEPPSFVVFLLLAENPQRLLPTVRSRCAEIVVAPEAGGAEDEEAAAFAALCESGDRIAVAERVMQLDKMEKADFERFLPGVKRAAVERIRQGGDTDRLMQLIAAAEEAERYQAVNVGRVHVTGMLLSRLT